MDGDQDASNGNRMAKKIVVNLKHSSHLKTQLSENEVMHFQENHLDKVGNPQLHYEFRQGRD